MNEKGNIPDALSSKQNSIATATHDLKNLLHNILNGIELIKDNAKGNFKINELASHVEKNAILASEIIQQVSGKKAASFYTKHKLNILTIIKETVDLFVKDDKLKINFSIDINLSNPIIIGNYTELKRALLNVIVNAKEASQSKTIIDIKVNSIKVDDRKQPEIIKISISDNGPGISKDNLQLIFRSGFSTKSDKTNSGIGLSVVNKIIEDHKGWINVKSELNSGTIFEFYLPKFIEKNLKDRKVIIAEDDRFQREVLKDLLTSMKLNVFTASSGTEALEMFFLTKPDLLFIDNSMPGMNGIECSEKIREVDNDSPIVLVTGSSLNETNLNGKVSKVLHKPYDFESIRSTLEELL